MAAFYISSPAKPSSGNMGGGSMFTTSPVSNRANADIQQSLSKALPKPPPEIIDLLAPRPYKATPSDIIIDLPSPQPRDPSTDSRVLSPFAIATPNYYYAAPTSAKPTKKPVPISKQEQPRPQPGTTTPRDPYDTSFPSLQGPIRRRPIGDMPSSPLPSENRTSRSQSESSTFLLPSTVYTPSPREKQDTPTPSRRRTKSDMSPSWVNPSTTPEEQPQASTARQLPAQEMLASDWTNERMDGRRDDREDGREDDTRNDTKYDTSNEDVPDRVMSYSSFISAYSQDSSAPTGISSSTSEGTISTNASSYMYRDSDKSGLLSPGYEMKEQSALSYVLAGHAYDDGSDYMTSALPSPATPNLVSPTSPQLSRDRDDQYPGSSFYGYQQTLSSEVVATNDKADDSKGMTGTGVTQTPVREQLQIASGAAAKTADASDLYQRPQPQAQSPAPTPTPTRQGKSRAPSESEGTRNTPTRALSPLLAPPSRTELDEVKSPIQSPKKRVGLPVGLPGRNIRPNRNNSLATTPTTPSTPSTPSREAPAKAAAGTGAAGAGASTNADVSPSETMGTGLSKLETKVMSSVKRKEIPAKGQAQRADLSPRGNDSDDDEHGRQQQAARAQDQARSKSNNGTGGGKPTAISAALSMTAASRSSWATQVSEASVLVPPSFARDPAKSPGLVGRDVRPVRKAVPQPVLQVEQPQPQQQQPGPDTPSRSEPTPSPYQNPYGSASGQSDSQQPPPSRDMAGARPRAPSKPSAFPTYTVTEPGLTGSAGAPQAGPNGVYPAPPPTAAHFNCMQNHRDMFRDPNTNYPLSCQTCQTFERSERWRCKWCYVRICTSCRGTLHTQANHDLATLMQLLNDPEQLSAQAGGGEPYYDGDSRMQARGGGGGGGGSADLFVIREA